MPRHFRFKMAMSKQVRLKHLESFNGLINDLLSKMSNEDRVRCKKLVENHKNNFRNIYEGPKPRNIDYNKKIDKIYKTLKDSLVVIDELENIPVSKLVNTKSLKRCIKSLRKLDEKKKNSNRLIYYKVGLILEEMKKKSNSEKEFESILQRESLKICKSVSYANKLIRFYNTCLNYKNLRYATLPIGTIDRNLTDLTKLMVDDVDFWNSDMNNDSYLYDDDYRDTDRSIDDNNETDTISDSILDSPENNSQSEHNSHTYITPDVDNLAIT